MNENENINDARTALWRVPLDEGVNRIVIEPYYMIGDDGKATRYPISTPDDFSDYLKGTNDWGFSHPGEDRPSYDDWKRSQDPDYEPDDGSIELPPEVMEAVTSAAEQAGMEPPYTIRINQQDCPDLFGKLEEATGHSVLFESPEDENGIKMPEWGEFIEKKPEILPGMFNPEEHILPDVSDVKVSPKVLDPNSKIQAILDPSAAPAYHFPEVGDRVDGISGIIASDLIPERGVFIEALNKELEGVDLESAFEAHAPANGSGPEASGLGDLIADGPDPEVPMPAPERPPEIIMPSSDRGYENDGRGDEDMCCVY